MGQLSADSSSTETLYCLNRVLETDCIIIQLTLDHGRCHTNGDSLCSNEGPQGYKDNISIEHTFIEPKCTVL